MTLYVCVSLSLGMFGMVWCLKLSVICDVSSEKMFADEERVIKTPAFVDCFAFRRIF